VVARQVFKQNFNDTISQEEHKTIYSGLGITGIALSNQSEFKKSSQFKNGLLPEDDLLRMAKSRMMTYQDCPNPGYDKPALVGPRTSITEIWCHWQVNLLYLERGLMKPAA
jgi:hypothetical protein